MARTREPAGFAAPTEHCAARPVGECTTRVALHRVAALLAAKGGVVAGITQGNCLQLLSTAAHVCTVAHYRSPYFYQLLHAVGVFGPDAAPTVSILAGQRQLSVEQLTDRRAHEPARGRTAGRLPGRTSDRHRPCQPDPASQCPRPAVLAGPGDPPPGHQLSPAPATGGHSLETADPHQNDPPHPTRRHHPGGRRLPTQRHQRPVGGPDLLPRHRPMGERGPRAMGTMGGPLPDQGQRDPLQARSGPPQVGGWTSGPENASPSCLPWPRR